MTANPPLTGVRVLELAGLAPGPFCGLLLANWGASVLRVDRPSPVSSSDLLTSGKRSIALDLKNPSSVAVFLSLASIADILIDPFRPGVLEKLGLDPETVLLKKNPRLIVVRLTGFRRDGKYSAMAGHDINYLAVSGVLSMLGARGAPPAHPANILADFAGGGHAAFTGVLLALIHRATSGKGQVVEANMVDGVSYLGTFPRLLTKMPMWNGERGTNTLDGGAPYYGCYECKDAGKYMSVGALEPQFWQELLKGLGLTEADVVPGKLDRLDKRSWPYMRELFTRRFKEKTRKEWEAIFDGTDACCAPVLEHAEMEAAGYEHRPIVGLTSSPARKVEMQWDGKALKPGEGGEQALREWMGWNNGRDYDILANGCFEKREKSRL
ncbi:alpha-methylacyl-CoA racemase [Cladophialophora psammophila CBS 110553]|uniref:Alpha-methylacyl-CoA racemase n=1 Tax=Cladophialophora psammophila CBS 110553 TaxID=1182543 RepID=W9Y281_9EURO|nr:alpha-methylacyl-CoA racemase [Cladophialophora psammophila CBS 110553]EXJ76579.1 alpha-methylacyl-CoA racemase [Cladophialophora psammophila CBS 110553]